ncbi:hypothetical protein HK44_007970 [Pseudomonas fluorescens HK44]|uniref:Uncharacterized protein n=1 Tax=Pseudomonas fluorescens HK44 TaxID=1042209 RepID=A0A010RNQ3_PSEFL|nr:hypothetical protein HK44_007970 [Pseudomonas fluorescens HK44]
MYDNQLALEAALMEFTLWVSSADQQKSGRPFAGHCMPLARMPGISSRGWPD